MRACMTIVYRGVVIRILQTHEHMWYHQLSALRRDMSHQLPVLRIFPYARRRGDDVAHAPTIAVLQQTPRQLHVTSVALMRR